jgi:hypothetical protein
MIGKNLLGIGKSIGNIGWMAAQGKAGRTAQAAVLGGAGGAAWGALSSDTSVLGGAMMGAGLGAGGARYGGRGLAVGRGARAAGMSLKSSIGYGTLGAGRLAYRDAKRSGAAIMSNKGVARVRSSLRGWGAGLGGGI